MHRDEAPAIRAADDHRAAEGVEGQTAAVLVTFHPDLEVLARVLEGTVGQVGRIYIVDNGSDPALSSEFAGLPFADRLEIVRLGRNYGVAYAQNRGLEAARARDYSFALILDQDSVPSPGMVRALAAAIAEAEHAGHRVSAAGPRYVDPRTGKESFFLALGGWRFRKLACADQPGQAFLKADWLISSGTLVRMEAIGDVGLMNEALFIDDVDTEWCLRARSKGYAVLGACNAVMNHTLGARTVKVRLQREHDVPVHSPLRLYYMVRNHFLLMRMPHVPWRWWLPNSKRLIFMLVLFAVFIPPRAGNLAMMLRGFRDGLRNRSGPYPA
jgi:rhamnosyltransferase